MRSSWLAAFGGILVAGVVGCGGGTAPTTADGGTPGAATPSNPIALTVHEFLDAVRMGNTASASERLTPLALKRTSEYDLNFSPPGSPTARFTVGEVKMVEADKAVVESVWTDVDADGKPNQETIVWALRQTEGKWQISGMAAELGPDQPPVVIDFENPQSMVEQKPTPKAPEGTPVGNPTAPLPTDKVASDPFQQATQR